MLQGVTGTFDGAPAAVFAAGTGRAVRCRQRLADGGLQAVLQGLPLLLAQE